MSVVVPGVGAMTTTLGMTTFDTTDAVRLAGWWAVQTGGRTAEETFGGT